MYGTREEKDPRGVGCIRYICGHTLVTSPKWGDLRTYWSKTNRQQQDGNGDVNEYDFHNEYVNDTE